jgi:hypothetical protein
MLMSLIYFKLKFCEMCKFDEIFLPILAKHYVKIPLLKPLGQFKPNLYPLGL